MPEPQQERADRLVVRKVISVPREEVFDAWLDAESMAHWMCPGTCDRAEAQIDPRVGGKFRIVMKDATRAIDHTGEYTIIDRPSKLQFTWISKNTNDQPTLVTVEFFDRGNQCELVLTHERFPRIEAVEPHTRGWSSIADKLAAYLETRASR